jgi:hypothetical protein
MFSDEACASPCPRFVKGGTDPETGMIQCAKCLMFFVDDEIIEDANA